MDDLSVYKIDSNPLNTFSHWYNDAVKVEQNPEAMTLSTFDTLLSRPDSRTVLFKGLSQNKLIFYTNYNSQKALEMNGHQEVSLLFYWHQSIRQCKIHGTVEKMDRLSSEKYFSSRDRQSQLASYISEQSSPIASKDELLRKLEVTQKEFDGREIPCPANWGGYLVTPYEFEFFIYGEYRLNDRFLFKLNTAGTWMMTRLQP
jgi:pyridoxamine 5'-phosphate oxidase